MKYTHCTQRSRGFSLIEMLVVITVIASMVAITIPQFANVQGQAQSSSARRNAQIIASTAENARVAGDLSIYEADDKEQALEILANGVEGSGVFEGVIFRIKLDERARTNVLPYLNFEAGILEYYGYDDVD